MAKKLKMVKLQAQGKNQRVQPFTLDAAKEILSRKYPGWELADENFIFEDGNFRPKHNTGEDQESKEQQSPQEQ